MEIIRDLDTVVAFIKLWKENKSSTRIVIVRNCNDDGYSCPSYYNTVGFDFFLPIIGWQSFDSFNPKTIFESEHFDYIYENIISDGKKEMFEKFIKEREIKKQKEREKVIKEQLLNRLGSLTDEEQRVVKDFFNNK